MSRDFAAGRVRVHRENGRPAGSRIETPLGDFAMPHWPSRIKDVRYANEDRSLVCVETSKGEKRFFGPEDTVGARTIAESSAGGSMGGEDPRGHGKIRYIIRAFGSWADGKQAVCVKRIATEHPEVLKGRDPNALCAWLKDQWAGTTKWRGSSKDPKQVAQDQGIETKARATAYARFTHAMPQVPNSAWDELVEDVEKMTGVTPQALVEELRGRQLERGESPFVALFEHDAMAAAVTAATAEKDLREANSPAEIRGLIGEWLSAHGAPSEVPPHQPLDFSAERIVTGKGPLKPVSTVDRRVLEVQLHLAGRTVAEPVQSATRTTFEAAHPVTAADAAAPVLEEEQGSPSPDLRDGGARRQLAGALLEGESPSEDDEGFEVAQRVPKPRFMRMGMQDLQDLVREAYSATDNPTLEGRRHIDTAGRIELALLAEDLINPNQPPSEEAGEDPELSGPTEPRASKPKEPQLDDISGQPDAFQSLAAEVEVTTGGERVAVEPPELRRGDAAHNCSLCMNYDAQLGACEAHSLYPVSEGELCGDFERIPQLNESQIAAYGLGRALADEALDAA